MKKIKQKREILERKREAVKKSGKHTVKDKYGRAILIGGIVKITNKYTRFSVTPTSKLPRNKTFREQRFVGYDCDKFGRVTDVIRISHNEGRVDKICFITDSGFETWRIAHNLRTHDGKVRSDGIDQAGAREVFHDAKSE